MAVQCGVVRWAERAQARDVVEVKGASHVVMVSHPEAVAKLIEEAAGSR